MLGGAYFYGYTSPSPRAAPQRSPILGVPFYLCVHENPLLQNYWSWRGNTWGGGLFQWSATPLTQRAGPQRYPILEAPFNLCVHPLTQNYQIWRGNIWVPQGLFLGSHPRPRPKGRRLPSVPQFGGFSSIDDYTL